MSFEILEKDNILYFSKRLILGILEKDDLLCFSK
jgi:hypothetical protein